MNVLICNKWRIMCGLSSLAASYANTSARIVVFEPLPDARERLI
jgi:hypothetical protein